MTASFRALLASPIPLPARSLLAAHALLLTSGLAVDAALLAHFVRHLASARLPDGRSAVRVLLLLLPRCAHQFNALISHLTHAGDPSSAFRAFAILASGAALRLDGYTLPAALKACARLGGLREGRQTHAVPEKAGFLGSMPVWNALVTLYGACGQCSDARKVFDEMAEQDVVSWTALASAFTRGGMFAEALGVLGEMDMDITHKEGTLVIALVEWHGQGGPCMDGVSSGRCKCPSESLEVFNVMQKSGVQPDMVVLSTVLSACANLGALESGRWVHEYIERKGIEWDVHVGTSVVDMYAKCGCLDTAVSIFQKMPLKNVSSWNALINGFALRPLHGRGKEALECFDRMVASGWHPNEVTFIAALGACCHSGLVQEGCQLFELMTKSYKLSPWEEHYGCMIDLLGRAALIQDAYDVIKAMPMRPAVFTWGALLSACQAHR
ncbi:hypothetical protein ABZP36_007764 [Zizania latifolia]